MNFVLIVSRQLHIKHLVGLKMFYSLWILIVVVAVFSLSPNGRHFLVMEYVILIQLLWPYFCETNKQQNTKKNTIHIINSNPFYFMMFDCRNFNGPGWLRTRRRKRLSTKPATTNRIANNRW